MSASSKKKLRKEQTAASMTEKQRAEQKEARKLKAYSIAFVVTMLAVLVVFIAVVSVTTVRNSGIIERSTVAATVGEHKINSAELNYYYKDIVNNYYNNYYSQYGDSTESIMQMLGLDLSKPLNEQTYPSDETMTWADYFLESAIDSAKSDYALADKAKSENYELSAEDQESLETNKSNMSFYASIYGYSDVSQYLKAMYGNGANEKSYNEYCERNALASAYYTSYSESLNYDDAAIREYEADIYNDYSYYTFASYYVNHTKFLGLDAEDAADTTDDAEATDETVAEETTAAEETEETEPTYTEEDYEQARQDAKAAAEALLSATNVDEFDAAIAAMAINAEAVGAASTKSEDTLGSGLSEVYKEWLTDSARKENDITCIPYETTTEDEDGNETKELQGYYVVLFQSCDNNERPMGNVRHLLVQFEGGTEDEDGNTTYSDEEKAAAKAEAEGYLETWNEGDATEDSFIALVQEYSDDSSATTGGLFEDINPASSYVENFLNWSIDPERKAGDTDVIESEYGYHVMYYVGNSELNYRDYLISSDMRTEDLEEWYDSILEPVTTSVGNTTYVELDLILSPSSDS